MNLPLVLLLLPSIILSFTLHLQNTSLILFPNQHLHLRFQPSTIHNYTITFSSIPNNWLTKHNDLVIPDFHMEMREEWSFDLEVVDDNGDYLVQTIKLMIED